MAGVMLQKLGYTVEVMTNSVAALNGREVKRIGIREFMMKPLSTTNLALTIRRVLNTA